MAVLLLAMFALPAVLATGTGTPAAPVVLEATAAPMVLEAAAAPMVLEPALSADYGPRSQPAAMSITAPAPIPSTIPLQASTVFSWIALSTIFVTAIVCRRRLYNVLNKISNCLSKTITLLEGATDSGGAGNKFIMPAA